MKLQVALTKASEHVGEQSMKEEAQRTELGMFHVLSALLCVSSFVEKLGRVNIYRRGTPNIGISLARTRLAASKI